MCENAGKLSQTGLKYIRKLSQMPSKNMRKLSQSCWKSAAGTIALVEIKSGNDYKKHAALNKVLAVEEWKSKQAIVFCKDNVQLEDGILYLPWYMAIFYKQEQLPEGLTYEVDLSGLC